MQKLFVAALLLALIFAAFASVQAASNESRFDFEGQWQLNENVSLYVCVEGNRVHGLFGEAYSLQAKLNYVFSTDEIGIAFGRYVGTGYKLGPGQQDSIRNFERPVGKILFFYNSTSGTLSLATLERKFDDFNDLDFIDLTDRVTSDLSDRTSLCGITAPGNNDTMTGIFESAALGYSVDFQLSENPKTGKANARITGSAIFGNYSLYLQGACNKWGQVCQLDYSYNGTAGMIFGSALGVLLSDGTAKFMNWNGNPNSYSLPAYINDIEWHQAVIGTRTSETSVDAEEFAQYGYNPLKCKAMTATECQINAALGSCVYEEGVYDEDFFVCSVFKA